MAKFDFSGWATRNDLLCADGRTIRKNAFKDNDGCEVPLVWNHEHNNPDAVLGHALLENRDDGVYAYGVFNDTEQGKTAKKLVQNGDVKSLSIWANQLKQMGGDVIHGNIRELSLVLAGANPGAYIDFAMAHSADEEDTLYASYDENIMLYHSDEPKSEEKGDKKMDDQNKKPEESGSDKTVQEVIDSMNEEQKTVMYALVGQALDDAGGSADDNKEGDEEEMKHNVFDKEEMQQTNVLSHSDEEAIVELAKQSNVGSLKMAMQIYAEENGGNLAHGVFTDADTEKLFPEYELLKKGEPETLERDQSWIAAAISKIHKSPYSRIRTRQADARIAELKAKGYQKKGNYKQNMADIKMIGRTTDPQTIYIKDDMHRDDIIDIRDFDVVAYQWKLMRHILDETLAMAALVGDGREEGDPDKIHEDHIRSIWHDDDLYCIHQDVDFEAAKTKLQGTNTGANFSENYIKAEAMIEAALYSREKFKGSGTPDLYCTPHLLNVMLLARDLNGRRIYDSKADLAAALNVGEIHTVEQFEGLQRETSDGHKKGLLGLFVNLADYQFGSTKGGEITKFEDFDMDFNRYKYMLETRLSGSLIKLYSAIALEEPIS
nr:MAG TPA: major capsid protein [Caudoviricetes sp.]